MQAFFEAIDRYEGIRQGVYDVAFGAFRRRLARSEPELAHLRGRIVSFGAIDADALVKSWDPMEFGWGTLLTAFRAYPKRFEVAIWVDDRVHALAYGRPSRGDDNVTIHFAERWMDDSCPLRGLSALLLTETAELYAKALGKQKVKIKDPYPEAKGAYITVGFSETDPIGGIEYMERRVRL